MCVERPDGGCPWSWSWKAKKVLPGSPGSGTAEKAEGVMPERSMMLEETKNK